jgi:putative ABC transport system permease protein
VVGIFGDARQASLTEAIRPEIVFPYAQNPVAWFKATTLLVHTRTEPLTLAEAVKARVWRLAPDLPITQTKSIDAVLKDAVGQERFGALLLGGFAATALLLAAVGIYAVMAYLVSRRAHEIGIRMALGAPAREVFKSVVGRGLVLSGAGSALGLAGAFATTRILASLLVGVSPTDPWVFVGVPLLLMAVSGLASALPAWRAARVDPLAALREE